jgi:hypothetical protein
MDHLENVVRMPNGNMPRTYEMQHHIERIWFTLKKSCDSIYHSRSGDQDYIDDYIYESSWRRCKDKEPNSKVASYAVNTFLAINEIEF